jgi:hypothetical protein
LKRALVLGLVAATTAACDPLATGDFKPAFVSVHGFIDGSTATATPAHVRVALMWQNDQTPGQNYADQLVDVVAQFPAAFTVDLNLRPRAQVIDSLQPSTAIAEGVDPAMRWSVATLVVYEDDGDGKLDVVGPNDPPSADRVLAAATNFDVWALSAGRPAPPPFIGIFPVAPAFSLVAEPPPRDPRPGECGRFTTQGHFSDLCGPMFDADPTLIDPTSFEEHLTLVDDPRLSGYTCNAYLGPGDFPDYLVDPTNICDGGACRFCRGFQCPLDLPQAGDPVTCSADKLSYVYKRCSDDPSLCNTRFCHFGHGELQAGDPVPPGWPCP